MTAQQTFLVFGATGQTGQHFVSMALRDGQKVRVFARTPDKLRASSPDLEVYQGTITDPPDLGPLVDGVDAVVSMLGDAAAQRITPITAAFIGKLVPRMRERGVTRLLHQAGVLSAAPDRPLPLPLRIVRSTVGRSYIGQHRDNEAVMRYLVDEAIDINWVVHRAAIRADGPSKGTLERSTTRTGIATFRDCAAYNLRLVSDDRAIHTCDGSAYRHQTNQAEAETAV